MLHWFHKRLEVNVKNPRENRCFQTAIVCSVGTVEKSNTCTVVLTIAAMLISVSTSVNNEMWVKLRSEVTRTMATTDRSRASPRRRRGIPHRRAPPSCRSARLASLPTTTRGLTPKTRVKGSVTMAMNACFRHDDVTSSPPVDKHGLTPGLWCSKVRANPLSHRPGPRARTPSKVGNIEVAIRYTAIVVLSHKITIEWRYLTPLWTRN